MNADAPLRRLVENPVALDGFTPRPGAPHPHHPLLTLNHAWEVHPRPAVTLPRSEEGIRRLAELTRRPVPTLDAELHAQAWHALLDRPSMRLPMRDPDEHERALHHIPEYGELPTARFARIIIGAVICEVALGYGGSEGLSCEPVCGMVDLIVLHDDDGAPTRAWANATWHASSIDVLETLELFWPRLQGVERGTVTVSPDSTTGRRRRGKTRKSVRTKPTARKRVIVVLPHYPIPDEPPDWNIAVAAMGNLLGLDVIAVRANVHKQVDIDAVARVLSSTPPALLLMAGAEPEHTTKLVEAYVAASGGPLVEHLLPGQQAPALLRDVRAALLRGAGIGVGLMPVGATPRQAQRDGNAPTIASLPDFPIQDEGRSGRYGGALLIEDRATGTWYSRDNARHGAEVTEQHGDAQYKTFREQNGHLILQTSADQHGNAIINKHESRRRGTISMKAIDWQS